MPSNLCRSASTLSHILRIAAASSGSNVLPSSCGRAVSKRSSWRRVLSMKASPSAMVIVFVGSENPSTFDADINTFCCGRLLSKFHFPDHAKTNRFSQAENQNCDSLRGQGCGIFAQYMLPIGHGKPWYFVPILDTRCRNVIFCFLTAELCSGDLSIRITCSMGCGLSNSATPTYRFENEGQKR